MEIHIFDYSIEKFIRKLQAPTIAKVLRNIDLLKNRPKIRITTHKKDCKEYFRAKNIWETRN